MAEHVTESALSPRGRIALETAQAGLTVIPGNASGETKRPLIQWQNGTDGPIVNTDYSAYAASIIKWWSHWPNADLFLITGSRSNNVCVLDLDEHPDRGISGLDTLLEWEKEHGALFGDAETVTAITGSGGYHIYFRDVRGELRGYAQPAGSYLGVDVRAENQIAVMPPSNHKSGRKYEWENDPHEYDILPATANLYEFIEFCRPGNSKTEVSGGKLKGFFSLPDVIPEGGRDETIYRLACSLQSKSMPDDFILSQCIAANRLRCKPPLPDDVVMQKVASALSKPKGHGYSNSNSSASNGGTNAIDDGGDNGSKSNGFLASSDKAASSPDYPDSLYKYDKDGAIVGIQHDRVGQFLLDSDFGACRIGGSPHLFNFERGIYEPGWDAFERVVINIYPPVTKRLRQEVTSWLNAMLPSKEREAPEFIPFMNGILSLDRLMAGEDEYMMTYESGRYITYQIPHAYNPDAQCPQVDDFLDTVSSGDEGVRANIIETFGLALYPARGVIQEIPDFIGFSSGNGKSTILKALECVVGKKNYCHMLPKDLTHDHKAYALDGKLVCIMDDIPLDHWNSQTASAMKNAITGGFIYTDVKYHDPYEFANIALIVIAANGYPSFSGRETEGILRRLHPIEMKGNFKEDSPNRDIHMLDKITTEVACEYWIRIGVDALMGVIERGGFTPSTASKQMRNDIRTNNDTVMAWATDAGVEAKDIINKPTQEAYVLYSDWCSGCGLKPLGKIEFVKRANAHFRTKSESKWVSVLQKNVKCFITDED